MKGVKALERARRYPSLAMLHVTALNRGAIPLKPELCTVTFGHSHALEAVDPGGEPLQQGFNRQQANSFLKEQLPIVEVWVSDQFGNPWVTDKVDTVNQIFEDRLRHPH